MDNRVDVKPGGPGHEGCILGITDCTEKGGCRDCGSRAAHPLDLKAAADQMLRAVFAEPWMSEADWQEFRRLLAAETGVTAERLAADIQIGVSKGYSVRQQMDVIRSVRRATT